MEEFQELLGNLYIIEIKIVNEELWLAYSNEGYYNKPETAECNNRGWMV